MAKKKRFTNTYLYRFLIITVAFAMVIGSAAAIVISSNVNDTVRYIILSAFGALYITALIFSYISYHKNKKED